MYINKFARHVVLFFVILIVFVISATLFVSFQKPNSLHEVEDVTKSKYLEETSNEYDSAIRTANIDIVNNTPSADSFGTSDENDANKLFEIAHLQYSFNLATKTVEYLAKILDSDSPEFEPYKSIAAYSLLHTFYDTGGDIAFMAAAVEKSAFMKEISTEAKNVFPSLFEKPFSEMNYSDKTLYFTSYLIALSDREDSLAIPANALMELSRAYVTSKKGQDVTKSSTFKFELDKQLSIVAKRLKNRLEPVTTITVSAHDTVTGLNLTSATISYLRDQKIESEFPETSSMKPLELLDFSYKVAQEEVPSLEMFTTYLNALYSTKYLDNTEENNKKIDSFVKRITGDAPFENLNEYSWATKHFINTKKDYSSPFFRRENIALIASRSTTLKEFLIMKDGWTDEDFLITN